MNGTALPASIGKFQVVEFLGQGAMGRVYLGEDPHLGRRVAIKVMSQAGDDETRARFHNEAIAAGRLSHPNIVQVYEFGSFEEQPYLAMEFLQGERLDEWLRTERTLPQKLGVLLGLCRAVEHAHERGVLHRDIKPSNLQVLPDGSCKLMDFGIARLESSNLTATGMILGTPEFIAPEVLQDCAYSPQADVYAVGLVAYWTLSGRNPFAADSIHSCLHRVLTVQPEPLQALCPRLPEALCEAVDACLRKDPNLRPSNPRQLIEALEAVTGGTATSATAMPTRVLDVSRDTTSDTESADMESPASAHRIRRTPILVAVVLLTALGLGYGMWRGPWTAPPPLDTTPTQEVNTGTPEQRDSTQDPLATSLAGVDSALPNQEPTEQPAPSKPTGSSTPKPAADTTQPAQAETDTPAPSAVPTASEDGSVDDEAAERQDREPAPLQATPPPPAEADLRSETAASETALEPLSLPAPRTGAPRTGASRTGASQAEASQTGASQTEASQAEAIGASQLGAPPPAEAKTDPAPALALHQVTPNAVRRGQSTKVVLAGSGLDVNPRAVFHRGNRETSLLRLRGVQLQPDGSLTGTLSVGRDAPLGLYTITLRDDSGRESNPVQVEVRL